jgi:branched-chain amino acid transport system ATP-binding protein
MPKLELSNVTAGYGEAIAIRDISLRVDEGEIVTLLGSNGVGKSTILRTISGLVTPRSGTLTYGDVDLRSVKPWDVIKNGIAHVPEGRRLFPGMSVRENLIMGAKAVNAGAEEIEARLEEVCTIFPRLRERINQIAGTMSGGEQQMCACGRALMAKPRLMLMDEPSLGLAPKIVEVIFEIIRKVNEQGVAILLVEQNATAALSVAHRAYLMENSRIVREGQAQVLAQDDAVRRAYLGI